jgi:hypothetical protein
LPKPAGSETSVRLCSGATARRSRRRGRVTRPALAGGIQSLVDINDVSTSSPLCFFQNTQTL